MPRNGSDPNSELRVDRRNILFSAFRPFIHRFDTPELHEKKLETLEDKSQSLLLKTILTHLNILDRYGNVKRVNGKRVEVEGRSIELPLSRETKHLIADSLEKLIELVSADGVYGYSVKSKKPDPKYPELGREFKFRPMRKDESGKLKAINGNVSGITMSPIWGGGRALEDETFIMDGEAHEQEFHAQHPVSLLRAAIANPKVASALQSIYFECTSKEKRERIKFNMNLERIAPSLDIPIVDVSKNGKGK